MTNAKIKSAAIAASFVAGAITMLLLNRRSRMRTEKWADEMREELKLRISETKDITQEKFNQIIDEIRPKYEAMKKISSREIGEMADEMKSHWEAISREAKKQMDAANKKTDMPRGKETGQENKEPADK